MPQATQPLNPELSRVEQFEQIMTVHGRELIYSLVVLIVGMLIVRWVMKPIRAGIAKTIKNTTAASTIVNIIQVLLFAIVFISAAVEVGINILPVFRLLMLILLIAIGLIVFFRPYIPTLPFKIGQTVKVGGLFGKVEATTFLNTRIRTFDGKVFFVPNKSILNDVVINYHYTPTRRMKIDIPVRYDQDIILAKQVLEEVMIEDPRVKKTPRPVVWVLDLTNGCVLLGGRCWADNLNYWSTRVDLLEKAKLRFDYEGIVVSFPHMGVHPYMPSENHGPFGENLSNHHTHPPSVPDDDQR
jgi:small conductance mechanosensitive channel